MLLQIIINFILFSLVFVCIYVYFSRIKIDIMKEKVNNRAIYAIYGSPEDLRKAEKYLMKYNYTGVLSNEGARVANSDPKTPLKYQWIIVYGASREYAYRFGNPTEGRKDSPPVIHAMGVKRRLKKDRIVNTEVKRFNIN